MKKKIVVFLIVGVLVLGLGISLAYFTPIITGNGKEISLVAKELKVIYTDTSAINTGIIEPGWTVTKSFTVENRSEDVYKYNIVIEDLVNTFETSGFLQYRITNGGSGYSCDWTDVPKTTEPTNTILAYSVSINDKEIQSYTIEFQYKETDEDQSADMGKSFSGNIMIEVGTEKPLPPFIAKLVKDNKDIKTRDVSSFSSAFTGTGGLYKEDNEQFLEEDGKKDGINAVYYFSGDATNMNNWVVFGGFWWRIIRTNEDGSVRLLYAGKATKGADGKYTGHDAQDGIAEVGSSKLTSVEYNETYDNTMYVGYMYGSAESLANNRLNSNPSTIKGKVDAWYDEHMIKNDDQKHPYGSYLSRTAVYCNDRATKTYSASSEMYYGAAMRLTTNASSTTYGGVTQKTDYHPTFKCGGNAKGDGTGLWENADNADKFTGSQGSTNIGNEALKDRPIALMTADEVAYAGGKYGTTNSNAWYYQNSTGDSITGSTWWWTMSPSSADSYGWAGVFSVFGSYSPGYLGGANVYDSGGVRPVVSLKSCVSVSGSGKTDDPYIPSIDSACVEADN